MNSLHEEIQFYINVVLLQIEEYYYKEE